MDPLTALASFRGAHRLLLLLAPAVQSPAYEGQINQFAGTDEACEARDLLLGRVLYEGESRVGDRSLSGAEAAAIRMHFEVDDDDFLAVLIGKDGTVKDTYEAPVAADAVFAAIDAMPRRQRDMQHDDDAGNA